MEKPNLMMDKYTNLFEEVMWPNGPTTVQFESDASPLESLISNVNAVPVTEAGKWIVVQLDNGNWEIPGGTVEPGERPLEALRRELMEEAGALLTSAEYIGAWRMHSYAEEPYRPHIPHPVAYRAVYLCAVELVSQPQVPNAGGENVVSVKKLSLEDAEACFREIGRHELAELYRFAAARHDE